MRYDAHPMPRTVRTLVLILAICATIGLSTASATHVDSSPGACNLCFVAHTVAFDTPSVQPLHGLAVVGIAALVVPVFGYRPFAIRQFSPRGPPFSAL